MKVSFFTVSVFISSLFFSAGALASDFADGLCNFTATSNPGLNKAICYFPSCPTGADCQAPLIDKSSAKIEYYEPLLQWKDSCPNQTLGSSCWEVYVDFKFRVLANDPAGVSAVGLNLASEVESQRVLKKFWVKAEKRDAQGRYELAGGIVAHVPPGKRLELAVHELCARDLLQNESCVPPGPNSDGLKMTGASKIN